MTLSSFPLAYLPISATLKRLDRSLEEVSLSLGKSQTYTFWHAIFPQLKPAIGSSLLLIALHMLVDFWCGFYFELPNIHHSYFPRI